MRRELEDTLIQRLLVRSILLHLAKEKGHQVHEMVVSSAVELIFQETAVFTEQVMAQECWQRKKQRRSGNGQSKGAQSTTGSCKGKTSRTGLSCLENPKSETSSETQESAHTYHIDSSYTDNSLFHDVWSYDEWNNDWNSV